MIPPVKFADNSDVTLVGLALPYDGPFLNKAGIPADLYGERFTKDTEMCLDWFESRPLLYGHGLDTKTGTDVVGRVTSWKKEVDGVWAEMILDKSSQYFDTLHDLVMRGKLFLSSGSMSHLVEVDQKTGDIKRWPWVELSLTETPANLLARVDLETAEKHWQEAGLPVKALTDRVKALPAGPTPVDGHGSYPDGSYEALMGHLNRAVSRLLCEPGEYDSWCYIVATFPGYVVACVCEGMEEMTYYEVEYKLDRAGLPTLGKSRQVERRYVPVEAPPAEMAATAVMSAHTVRSATALAARVRVLHEGRVKEGRVLSPTNRARLQANHDALTGLVKAYADLLADTEPKTSAEVGTTRAAVEVQAAHARILALASGVEIPS